MLFGRFLVVDVAASSSSFSSSSGAPLFFCCFSFEKITQRNKILPGIEFETSLFSSGAARRGGSAPRVKLLDNFHPLGRVRVSSKQDALYICIGLH